MKQSPPFRIDIDRLDRDLVNFIAALPDAQRELVQTHWATLLSETRRLGVEYTQALSSAVMAHEARERADIALQEHLRACAVKPGEWSTTPPTEPGFYAFASRGLVLPVWVFYLDDGKLRVIAMNHIGNRSLEAFIASDPEGFWGARLVLPEKPSKPRRSLAGVRFSELGVAGYYDQMGKSVLTSWVGETTGIEVTFPPEVLLPRSLIPAASRTPLDGLVTLRAPARHPRELKATTPEELQAAIAGHAPKPLYVIAFGLWEGESLPPEAGQ